MEVLVCSALLLTYLAIEEFDARHDKIKPEPSRYSPGHTTMVCRTRDNIVFLAQRSILVVATAGMHSEGTYEMLK
jgi:hypothetical protein